MNVANVLTLFRLVLIPVYLIIFFSDTAYSNLWAFFIVLLAGVSDILDGYIARRYNLTTELGAMLDPLADKLMMLTVFLSLLISTRISIWAGIAIIIRDVGMIIGSAIFHFRGKKTVPANVLGKATTVLYYTAFSFLIFGWPFGRTLLWIVIVFSFFTSLVYIVQFRSLNRKTA